MSWAAQENAAAVARILAKGAEVAKDNDGSFANLRTQENAAAVARILIAKGAEVEAKDNGALRLCSSGVEKSAEGVLISKARRSMKRRNAIGRRNMTQWRL